MINKQFDKYNNAISDILKDGATQFFSHRLYKYLKKGQDEDMVHFLGNGGSASVAAHMAEDYTKCGNIKAKTFSDMAAVSCFANDFGWPLVFKKYIEYYVNKISDAVILISSSGNSENIVNAANYCLKNHISLFVLSGFDKDNKLNSLDIPEDHKLHVPYKDYGLVENIHSIVLHAILDEIAK